MSTISSFYRNIRSFIAVALSGTSLIGIILLLALFPCKLMQAQQSLPHFRMVTGAGKSGPIKSSSITDPTNFTATPATPTSILLQWQKNANNNNVMIAFSSDPATIGTPVDGTTYAVGSTLPGGGTVIYFGSNTSYTHNGLQQYSYYYYKAWSYDASISYSSGVTTSNTPAAPPQCLFTASNLTPDTIQGVGLYDNSSYLPTAWAWQITPSNFEFINGSTANSQSPYVRFTTYGSYTVTLAVSNAWGTDTKIRTSYITVGPPSYCTPSFVYGTSAGDYISKVELGSISNNTTGSEEPYYTHFNDLSTNLIPGNDYTITMSPGTYPDGNYLSVWIDYNQDLFFGPDERLGCILVQPAPATGTISFTVPLDAVSGITRMRVRETWMDDNMDACSPYSYGETEDYNINMLGLYCTPIYDYGTSNGDYISHIQLEAIDHYSDAAMDPPYYTYYTDQSADLMPGTSYFLTLSPGVDTQENWFSAWIDYNYDQLFEADEFIGDLYIPEANSSGVIFFTLPTDAIVGVTRLRIREIAGESTVDPCGELGGGETEDYNVNILNPYCIPGYNFGSVDDNYISLVQLGTINNASEASESPYYTYYMNKTTELELGSTYSITLRAGPVTTGNHVAVWIDYNNDLFFGPGEELGVVEFGAYPSTGILSFTVPVDLDPVMTRMRVRLVNGETDFDDCSTYSYGETEDYNINLVTSYCIPTYINGTVGGDYISLVQLGSINNSTSASISPFYSFFSDMSTDLVKGSNYDITLSPGTYPDHNNMEVFIDFNRDNIFEQWEMLGNILVDPTPATGTISFTVPVDAISGTTRMRVREVWSNGNFDACSQYEYGETEDYYVNIVTSGKILDLTAYPEGIWNGSGLNKAQNESGNQYAGDIADKITVELHSPSDYSLISYAFQNVDLSVVGHAFVILPQSLTGNYYLTIKHRNSVETVSALPISFAPVSISYDFTTAASTAFGDNLVFHNGHYCLYGGDVNQDGIVDSGDMIPVDNLSSTFGTGYVPEDVNGDGIIDSGDMIIVDNRSSEFIGKLTP